MDRGTVAREALISKYCAVSGMADEDIFKYDKREKISKWLGNMANKVKPQTQKQQPNAVNNLSEKEQKLAKLWGRLTQLRNQIDHAFMETAKSKTKNATGNVRPICEEVIKYLNKEIEILKSEITNIPIC